MSINHNASIEVTALKWAPDFAQGLVRDLRVRWALEEAGLDYRVGLLGSPRPADYVKEQPFDQVPCFSDDQVRIFESGAIVQYIGQKNEGLLPRETQAKYRAIQWTYAALNSVEPAILAVFAVTVTQADQKWAKLRRPAAEEFARLKLKRVSDWLGDKQWLEGDRFTIGDLIMVTVLRNLNHTGMVAEFTNLAAYQKRGESRPAFQRALADQLATFAANQPQAETKAAAA
jgi:glutathione S-transferase